MSPFATESFGAYIREFNEVLKGRGAQFIASLNELAKATRQTQQRMTTLEKRLSSQEAYRQTPTVAGSGTSGGYGQADPYSFVVKTTELLAPGRFVSYHGATIEYADATTNPPVPATHIVVGLVTGGFRISGMYPDIDIETDGDIYFSDSDSDLFIGSEGRVTSSANVFNETGNFVDGVYMSQRVGRWNGLSLPAPEGFIKGEVNVREPLAFNA